MMQCPECGSINVACIDTRTTKEAADIRRRRKCLMCGHRWNTVEIPMARLEELLRVRQGSSTSKLYRKVPVVVEAFKLGVDHIPDWFMDAVTANEVVLHGTSSGFDHVDDTNADIRTLEGWHHANYGDYIIRGVKGELYPCKPDIFERTYMEVPR